MSDVSTKLRDCIDAMNTTFSSKQDNARKERAACCTKTRS